RCRAQPPGALDRARARWPGQGSARCAVQDRQRPPRHLRCTGSQAGPKPLRRQEGGLAMPRKGPAPRRDLMPDPLYRSVLVTQVVNKILTRGKRTLAERIVYDALDILRDKT